MTSEGGKRCKKQGCERPAFEKDKEGYCFKHGWEQVVLKFMDTPESNLMFSQIEGANNPLMKRAVRDAMLEIEP